MKFKIYFEQINQQMYEIEAKDEEQAIEKAEKQWRILSKKQKVLGSVWDGKKLSF
jgi:hypothetical protein